jgi:hypothetical protein
MLKPFPTRFGLFLACGGFRDGDYPPAEQELMTSETIQAGDDFPLPPVPHARCLCGHLASTDARQLPDAPNCQKDFVRLTSAEGAARHCEQLSDRCEP